MITSSVHLWIDVRAGRRTSEALPHSGEKAACLGLQELLLKMLHSILAHNLHNLDYLRISSLGLAPSACDQHADQMATGHHQAIDSLSILLDPSQA